MKTRDLKKLNKIFGIIVNVFAIIGFIAFFGMAGGIGHFDYVDEAHIIMSAEETRQTYLLIIISTLVMIVATIVICFFDKLNDAIASELRHRKNKHIARKEREYEEYEREMAEMLAIAESAENSVG